MQPMTEEMLPALAASFADVFNGAPWYDSWTQAQALERLTDLYHTPKFDGAVEIADGRIISAIMGRGEQYFDGVHFQILEFWVDTALQRQGIGGRLLDAFTAHLYENGIQQCFLLTMRTEQTEGFYRKHGFVTENGMCLMQKNGK